MAALHPNVVSERLDRLEESVGAQPARKKDDIARRVGRLEARVEAIADKLAAVDRALGGSQTQAPTKKKG